MKAKKPSDVPVMSKVEAVTKKKNIKALAEAMMESKVKGKKSKKC